MRVIHPLWWWNAAYSLVLAIAAVLVTILLGPLFTTPQLTAVDVTVMGPTAILSGLLGSLAVGVCLKEPVSVLPWAGPRDIRVWRVLRVLAVLGPLLAVMLVVGGSHGGAAIIVCGLSLSGEALLIAALVGEDVAWTLPLLHAGITLTFGTDVFGSPHSWAWILQPEPGVGDVVLSALLFTVGLFSWAYRRPRA